MKPAYTYRALVRHVTDGDTIIADIDLGLNQWSHKQKFRLCLADGHGIDAPEMSGPAADRGRASRDHLVSLLQTLAYKIDEDGTFEVTVVTKQDKQEKYGRWLATLYGTHLSESVDLCRRMVDDGHAVVRDY